MGKFHFTNKAVEDLSSIWNYTCTQWSEAQADRYYKTLVTACQALADNPRLYGRDYAEIRKDLFGFKIQHHIIFYLILSKTEIEVVRILHEQMDLPHRLEEK